MHYVIHFCFSLTEIIIGLFGCNAIYFRCGLAKDLYVVIKVFPQRDKEILFILLSLWLLKLGLLSQKRPKYFYMSHACTGFLLNVSSKLEITPHFPQNTLLLLFLILGLGFGNFFPLMSQYLCMLDWLKVFYLCMLGWLKVF